MGHSSHSYNVLLKEIDDLRFGIITREDEIRRLKKALSDIEQIENCQLVKDRPDLWAAACIERARGALRSGL
jgi:hypothetical protein